MYPKQVIWQVFSVVKDSMEDFKLKVEKLMFMKTSGLISREEFEEVKKRFLITL